MSLGLDETHDPDLRSWVASAHRPGCDFTVQNLPYGVFRDRLKPGTWRGGVAIGDQVLDLAALAHSGLSDPLADTALRAASGPVLNPLMAMGPSAWRALRRALSQGLRADSPERERWAPFLLSQSDVEMGLPAEVGDYTDFYISIHHATNVGRMFRPDNPLLPNYRWVPIGYHGRSSSLAVSGDVFNRPRGQLLRTGEQTPMLGPTQRLDHELELGLFIGAGNERGAPIPLDEAESAMFGLCLLNDWSARDFQAWEYLPLGPFLSKNFATTLSPWIVTMDALAPYRTKFERAPGEPQPLPYLDSEANRQCGAIDLNLEVDLQTQAMRQRGDLPTRISSTNFRRTAYWTLPQLVAHHTVNGCNLRPGDLMGSGTQSGPDSGEEGSMLELTRGGREPLTLPDGDTRAFFEDGDTVVLRGWCERPGLARVGFGEARATIAAA